MFYVFVIEKDGVADSEEEVIQHLKQLIRKQIGGFAVPEAFLVNGYHNYIYCTYIIAHCTIYIIYSLWL